MILVLRTGSCREGCAALGCYSNTVLASPGYQFLQEDKQVLSKGKMLETGKVTSAAGRSGPLVFVVVVVFCSFFVKNF